MEKKILLMVFGIILFISLNCIVSAETYCYQESANVTTACGGLDTGNYYDKAMWQPSGTGSGYPVIDGDWDTSASGMYDQGYGYILVNYTKPTEALDSSLWQVKDEEGIFNLTIPSDCWNYDANKILLQIESYGSSAFWECYNGSWSTLRTYGNYIVYEDAMIWDVTVPDYIYPIFSSNQTSIVNGSQYNPENIYRFNITIANSNGTAGIQFNNINYSMSNLIQVFNKTFLSLGVGTYSYLYWAYGNGTNNNFNNSQTYSYTIVKNNTLILGLTATTPITYGTSTNFAGSGCPGELTCGLNITNGVFSAGTISANYSTVGNANYSGKSVVYTVTIDKAIPIITKKLNSGTSNITIIYPQQVNATGSSTGGIIKIYRNNVDKTSENGLNVSLSAGGYIYQFNITGNENYSDVIGEYMQVNISKATPILTFLANGGTSNLTLNYSQQINMSAVASSGTVGLDRDNINDLSNNSLNVTLPLGTYIYRSNITGNENYSDVSYSYYNITIVTGDITAPNLTIIEPFNNSVHAFPGWINLTLTVNVSSDTQTMWYNIDNGINFTFVNQTGIHFAQANGEIKSYWIYVYANDSAGNVNSSSVYVTIAQTGEVSLGGGSGPIIYNPIGTNESNVFPEEIITQIEPLKDCEWNDYKKIGNCLSNVSKNPLNVIILISVIFIIIILSYEMWRKK